eukprot:TRINITY_DN13284_c0_g1_i1.p1 TRINITY_DN13284_c0_g1~~TRINITY_DN13284_c0_g1_i1.p1  ORF type:complete len:150 (-),score=10.64 TRINITY_DN13284_c0_g1_i1:23-472(-)
MNQQAENAYQSGVNLNRFVLDDIKKGIPDEQIIEKIRAVCDYNLDIALWGTQEGRYIPLHHAASHGREVLTRFILTRMTDPRYINMENDNFLTALRYARRENYPNIVRILMDAGATEPFRPIHCRNGFVLTSQTQAKRAAVKANRKMLF